MDGRLKSTAFNTATTWPPTTTTNSSIPLLHTHEPFRRTPFNRAFAIVYLCAILALFYLHTLKIFNSNTFHSFVFSLPFLIADAFLAFQWATAQTLRMCPIRRREFPENLEKVISKESDYPAVNIFICTADPFKEPPMGVVNTALSVMAYDYPTKKISVYVSDDGGSELTLFAFMEAAKFSRHWLPFCKRNKVVERSPEAYFRSNRTSSSESKKIQAIYESMKLKVESVMKKGKVMDEYIDGEEQCEALSKWNPNFTRKDHPTIIEVRVSATMTNAPILLTQDCDMYSNDPQTLKRMLCYFADPTIFPSLAFVQFPPMFHGLNKNDTYGCEYKHPIQINPTGMDGLRGTMYVGTGCFFSRRALFGGPSSFIQPEIPGLSPYHVVQNPILSQESLEMAHHVASCRYENQTQWGAKMGFRYGSLLEDNYTSFRLHCDGWRSIFCNPDRPAFLGAAPISLIDLMCQVKRWMIGTLEMLVMQLSPLRMGIKAIGLLATLNYTHFNFWPTWSIPVIIYAFIPQLALLNSVSLFPKVTDPWFLLYLFMFVGAYIQELLEQILAKGTFPRWWNSQRMWMMNASSSFLVGCLEFSLTSLGIVMPEFNVTSKAQDDELRKRYEKGLYEFGVWSPLFVPMTMAAIINLIAPIIGVLKIASSGENLEGFVMQILLCGFGMINSWPIYEAIVIRSDKGKMNVKTTTVSLFLVLVMCRISHLIFLL
ncbi:hypothetical protein Ancab_015536 [Ancistrocladus abbreviatus]